ncbi:AcrR family transcriptional regulator [Dysgonomonas sp. PFB1-18]|uniref:TetR/AcrR family transcriptional regulator n=1 Tax=unclassified Dysgonomonas TaxID=2630389 RepID=UPI002476DBC2|nr:MULTISPECIES: TetR/AcrR family transcriptional regulator [unclassified Dysgonomonas]MDL2302883.1 TetR/AcrR family transcriptional regulator [Dysgonomonas sp. OttesenSCG-928-D17]MDH6309590.1 AcrR family transcriptional regulator [Dysgonomonas sp. PF1-14]MDH6339082.1 AcrR family transcriptional regulator [Dysgonomonas sp. PF1-16]MDH6380632.1 AcrR family transcriptional regulator [Dysgonomonas sp. PFB1-18]MDH6398128.1 AcrR family transcriptional regulator [Dysgonomonas sp. PF1-23]
MKYSREYILRRAFDVFMNKGYDSASISVLQEELNMSRGAMYRYFKNKEELFFAVVDEYFFNLFEKILKSIKDDLTAKELIELIHRRQKLFLNAFTRAGVTHTFFLNYTALMIQAAKYYPNFIDRFGVINRTFLDHWKTALENSIENKEVREDIDIEIMCILFNNTSVKESSDRSSDDSMFTVNILRDMEKRKKVMDYLYSLIKV